jgi:hypothetical protein
MNVNTIMHANTTPAITYNDLSILAILATKRFIVYLHAYTRKPMPDSVLPASLLFKCKEGCVTTALFY